jgi:uroporphyrinogen decarboxylase
MDAESLAKKYNGKIVFLGGGDTQRLLPFGKPDEVRREVLRLRGGSRRALKPCRIAPDMVQ